MANANLTKSTTAKKQRRRRAKGEGSIYQRKDGRWAASLSVLNPDGSTTRKTYYGKSRNDVSDQLKTTLAKQVTGEVIPTTRATVGEFLDRWIEHHIKPYKKPLTVVSYSQLVRLHIKPKLGHKPLARLTSTDVQAFITSLVDAELSPRTTNYALTVLKMGLDVAVQQKVIPFNVAQAGIAKPARKRAHVEAITPERAKQIVDCVRGHRLGALITLAIYTGLRRGELLGLSWNDINFDEHTLSVRHTQLRLDGEFLLDTPKTESSRRKIKLSPPALQALKEWRKDQLEERIKLGVDWQDSGFVFTDQLGQPLEPREANRALTDSLAAAGIEHCRFHDLRHAAACLMLTSGVDLKTIASVLGHSSIRTTADTYLHTDQTLIGDAMDRLAEAVAKSR